MIRCEWTTARDAKAELLAPGEVAPDGQTADDNCWTLVFGGDDPLCITAGAPYEFEDMLRRAIGVVREE